MAPVSGKRWVITDFTGFDKLKLEDSEPIDPDHLGPNDVLVKMKAISLNFRDLVIPQGLYPMPARPGLVPGSDGAATVLAIGKDVTDFSVGDHVVTLFSQGHQAGPMSRKAIMTGLGGAVDGTIREYAVFPETGLVKAPAHLSYAQAATLSCAALTAWNALYGLRPIKPGDTVLVQGSGGVSAFGLQFAKAAGAVCIATTSSQEKADMLKRLGADHVINYKTTPDWGQEARKLTPNSEGVDYILEVGGPKTLNQSMQAIRFEGIISIIGFVGGGKDEANMSFVKVLEHICTLRGLVVGSRQQMIDMVRAMEVNKITPIIDDKKWEFEELVDAYKYMWDQKHFGKVVVHVDKDQN